VTDETSCHSCHQEVIFIISNVHHGSGDKRLKEAGCIYWCHKNHSSNDEEANPSLSPGSHIVEPPSQRRSLCSEVAGGVAVAELS